MDGKNGSSEMRLQLQSERIRDIGMVQEENDYQVITELKSKVEYKSADK